MISGEIASEIIEDQLRQLEEEGIDPNDVNLLYNYLCTERDRRLGTCPKCGKKLKHFSGLEKISSFLYCIVCNDIMYNYNREPIGIIIAERRTK